MLKGFKEFISRGNVIDLAVAVVIGAAFSAVISSVVDKVINPAIGALFQADNLDNALTLSIPALAGEPAQLQFGAVIGALIQFLIVAAFVYFVIVMPINRLKKITFAKRDEEDAEKESAPTELELLGQIRDLLATATNDTGPGKHQDEGVTSLSADRA